MKRRESGSIFVETMIAAAIVAISLGSMYSAVGDSARRDRLVQQKHSAILIAQSELAAVGSVIPLSPGMTGGVAGPYAWRVDVAPYRGLQGGVAGQLMEVTASVRALDGATDIVTLKSLALAPGS